MNQHQIVVLTALLSQSVNAVADGLLSVMATGKYPLQFIDAELVGIRLYHSLPSCQTYHCNAVNIGMLLEGPHRVDDNRAVVYMHKLFGNVLTHAVARSSGYYQCVVHILPIFLQRYEIIHNL